MQLKNFEKFAGLIFLFPFLFLFLMAGCATSPTGRVQAHFLPNAMVNEIGVNAFDEMKSKQPINRDPKVNAYVKCVADEITNVLPQKQSWEVVVFEVAEPNAFALPGGKIGVHTGMLRIAKDQAQLAAVLGHEVGHVLANHSNERMSTDYGIGLITKGVDLFANRESKAYAIGMAIFGAGAQYGYVLPHSRTQESEADVIGLDLMSKAGFDPRQSIELWKNMEAMATSSPPEFQSTHPSNNTRIQNLQSKMPGALQTFVQNKHRAACRL